MATKALSPNAQTSNRRRTESGASKLRKLIAKQQALTKQLRDLMEELEDAEDGRRLEAAIKENQGRPLIPWEEAKKKLGLKI